MILSNQQRFQPFVTSHSAFAPLTLGAPVNVQQIDLGTFKKNKEEKAQLFNFKKLIGKTRGYKFKTEFKGSF